MSCSVTLNDIYYESFLEKQRKVKAWSWKNYWFVLEGDQLGYYKDKERIISRGLIDLALAKTVRACAAPTKGFPFEIVTSSRSHTLSAKTVELRDKWVELCGKAMLLSYRRSRSMHRPSCDSISDDDLPDSVLDDLQNTFPRDSFNTNGSGSCMYSQSTPNTPVAPHPSRASRSRSNEEPETDFEPSPSRVTKRRMCRKTKSEFLAGSESSQEKMALKLSQSNTSSSSMSTEDDEVFTLSETPPKQIASEMLSMNHAVLRRNMHLREERNKGLSNGTSSSSSSLWSNKASSISSTSTIAEDSSTTRESSLSCTDTIDDIPDDIYLSKADSLEQGPLTTINFTQSRVAPLPYPRLELVNKSVEDLRGCIARIRKPDEVFAKPHPNELGGKAMNKLKSFLTYLDSRGSNGVS